MAEAVVRLILRQAVGATLLFCLWPMAAGGSDLRAGVARVEITPVEPAYMAGYSGRTSPSAGVHDPLYARVLVLGDGGSTLALVSLDLCWFPSARVPREAAERLGVGLVLMAASHTHSGPDLLHRERWDDPRRCDELMRRTEGRVLEAIEKARSDMFRARLSVARGNITLGYHRLVMQPDGRRKPLWRNPERIPIGPVDPEVAVIRVEDVEAQTTRAVVVNYACHPVCLGSSNLLLSADYVGPMAAKVEGTIRGALCLFVQGGAGSVNPLFQGPKSDPPEDFERARKMGEFLADEVLRALSRADPVGRPGELLWRTHVLTFADRWSTTKTVEIGMATVLINRTIGMVAIPGEPFLHLQVAFKRAAPVDFPVFLGYTNSVHATWPEYIPDIRSAAEGGYGADRRTYIEVGGGERLVNQAVADLYWMKGMLRPEPGKP